MALTQAEILFLRLGSFLLNSPALSNTGSVVEANSASILANLSSILSDLQAKADATEDQYSLARFSLNGTEVTVTEDIATPSNNAPLPVKLTGVTGDINITAGDLAVQLSHLGVNFDSTRIGDGTNLLSINADGSINIDTGDITTSLVNLLTELQSKADLSETQPVSIATLPLASGASTETTLALVKTVLDSLLVEIALKANLTDTQPVSIATTTETPSKTTVIADGTVASGAKSVTFITSSDFTGSILGDTAQASAAYLFTASLNNTLGALAYVITTGSIEILKIV